MLEWIVSASVLIIAVMVGRRLLKGKISCWVQYSLWLLVAVRLLVPAPPLESMFSIANLLPESWSGRETEGIPEENDIGAARGEEPGQGGILRWEDMPNIANMPVSDMDTLAVPQPTASGQLLTEGISSAEKKDDFLSENVENGFIRKVAELGIWGFTGTVWLTGSFLLALWLLGVNGSFRWRVYRNRLPMEVSKDLQSQLQGESGQGFLYLRPIRFSFLHSACCPIMRHMPCGNWKILTGVSADEETAGTRKCRMSKRGRKQLPVYMTDEIGTPCMYGLLRPAIYITARTAEDSQVLAMVLCHEQMHYRHMDHIWSVVRMLCLCLHWYNPLVWAAVGLSRQDGELACDEGVLRQLGEKSRKRYGEALLALSMEHKPTLHSSLNLATSMSDTKKQLKERLSALVKMPRMAAGTAALVLLLALGLMVCTLTSRVDAHEEDLTTDKAGVLKMALQDSVATGASARHTVSVGGADSQGMGTEAEVPASGQSADGSFEDQENMEQESYYNWPWVLAEEYTGYLDEVDSWEHIYQNQDYDRDGLTDRIYQDVDSEPGVMTMRVEFGNGEVLSFDTYQNSPLMVQSLDLDGDGNLELLFTTPNEFSTNPPSIGTDILLFTRQENGYRQVEVALEETPEEYGSTPWEVYLVASCGKEDDSHIRISWRVPGAEENLEKTQVCLRPADERDMDYFFMGQYYVVAYDAELIQEEYPFLRLYFEVLSRSGDRLWVDMALENGELIPVSSAYEYWDVEEGVRKKLDLEKTGVVYDNWDAQTLEYYDEEGYLVAEVTEGDITRKLTFVETSWSISTEKSQLSREVLYWACQALLELEQWTGTRVTEVCYTVSEWGDFYFGLTPEDMRHSRIYYSRCYNGMSFTRGEVIEHIDYSTDMDVWYSPVKQYTTPPGYDRMTTQERLIWFFERSAIARGSKVEEVIYPWEGDDYLFRTDQGTYYDFAATEGIDTLGKGLYLVGPYDDYPQH